MECMVARLRAACPSVPRSHTECIVPLLRIDALNIIISIFRTLAAMVRASRRSKRNIIILSIDWYVFKSSLLLYMVQYVEAEARRFIGNKYLFTASR